MIKTKDAYYFSHDSNAKDDPKCVMLIEQLGLEGYGIYWVLIETLRDQPEYKYPLVLIPAIARRYNTTAEKMKTVIGSYGLFTVDDNDFFSLSLLRRMEVLEEKRIKKSLAGKKGNEVRWQIAEQSQCDNDANAEQSQIIASKENNSTSKNSKSKDYISIPDVDYVKLTQKQYDNIVSKYGKDETDRKILDLNVWKGAKGGKSKDDNLTLQNWLRRDKEKEQVKPTFSKKVIR